MQLKRPASHLFLAVIGAHLSVSTSVWVFFFHDDDVIKTQGHFIRRSRRILTEQQSTATRSSSQLTSHRDPNIPFLSTRSPVIVYPLSLARSIFITLQAQLRFAIRVELRFQRSTMINLDNHAEKKRVYTSSKKYPGDVPRKIYFRGHKHTIYVLEIEDCKLEIKIQPIRSF